MKRVLTLVALTLALVSCHKNEIREIHDQITELRDVELASLKQQADAISGSIDGIDGLITELNGYVKSMDETNQTLQKKLDNTNTRLGEFKTSAQKDISTQQSDLLASVDKMNDALNSKYDEISVVVASLKKQDTTITGHLTALKVYMDDLYTRTDWADATLATLEKQNEILEDVANIKAQVVTVERSIEVLDSTLKAQLDTAIAHFKSEFNGELASEYESILADIRDAVDIMKSDVSSHYSESIKTAVAECESDLKTWISDKLTEYYKVDSAKAQAAAFRLIIGNVPQGQTLQGQIDQVLSDLQEAEQKITDAYTLAIKEAIEKYEGKISDAMDTELQNIENNTLKPLAADLVPIGNEITKLWEEAGKLSERINSVAKQSLKIQESIAVLAELEKTLDQYVGDIKSKLEQTDADNRAKLEKQLKALRNEIIYLNSQISSLQTYVGELPTGVETDVTTWIQTTFNTLNAQFDAYATVASVDGIVNELNERIKGHDDDIKELNEQLENLIDDSRSTIQGWINDKLTAYTTAAEADKLLHKLDSTLTDLFQKGDEGLQTEIDNCKDQLTQMKARVENAYKDYITTSIETEQGNLTPGIKSQADAINDDITSLVSKSKKVQFSIDSLSKVAASIKEAAEGFDKELNELETFLKVNDYKSLAEAVTDLRSKIANLSTVYADKKQLDSVYNYVKADLKTESDRIVGLVDDMKTVDGKIAKLTDFLDDVDISEKGKFKATIDEIDEALTKLESSVNGTGSSLSLESQIQALEAGLYGAAKDPENPSEESICGMINTLTDFLLSTAFSSITYVPRYLNHKEQLNYSPTDGVSATFNFYVKPASIARLINQEEYSSKYCKMRFVKDGTLYDFQNCSFTGSDDGTITAEVKDSRYELLKSGASAALYVTSTDSNLPSFTSKFIALEDLTWSDQLYSDKGNLQFTSAGGTKTVKITAKSYFSIKSCPSWVHLPAYDTKYMSWTENDAYGACTDKDFAIQVEANTSYNTRSGDVVLTLGLGLLSSVTLTIHIVQDGSTVLFTDIPASGGTFNNNIYEFTLYNTDSNFPYLYLSQQEKSSITGYNYVSVQYLNSSGEWVDFPTTKESAIKASTISIRLDASLFYKAEQGESEEVLARNTKIAFTTLTGNSSGAYSGSSISFTITRRYLINRGTSIR